MNKKYKITVIGAGDRGNTYMNMLKQYYDGQLEMVCVCDLLSDRQQKAFEQFGFSHQQTDWRKAIADYESDIVVVATPAFFHCDMADYAMDHGRHVLTEKPFDLSLKKCYALRAKQEKTGLKLAIGMQYRNNATHRAMKHMIDAGYLGENRIISYNDFREVRPKVAMHDAVNGNGGPMTDMACHLFDLMRWFYGCDPQSVSCTWRANAQDAPTLSSIDKKAPDTCVMTITYESGDIGVITMNWGLPPKVGGVLQIMAIGKTGYMGIDWAKDGEVTVQIAGGAKVCIGTLPEDAADLVNAEKTVFDCLIAEIEGTGKIQNSYEEGIVSLATSMAAIQAGALGRPVSLKEIYTQRPTIAQCMDARA